MSACVSFCLHLSLFHSLSVSLPPSLCVSYFLCLLLSFSLSRFLLLSLSLNLCLLSLYIYISLSPFIPLSLPLQNEEAEELMRRIEKEEERLGFTEPDKQCFHLCIVNLGDGARNRPVEIDYCCWGEGEKKERKK